MLAGPALVASQSDGSESTHAGIGLAHGIHVKCKQLLMSSAIDIAAVPVRSANETMN